MFIYIYLCLSMFIYLYFYIYIYIYPYLSLPFYINHMFLSIYLSVYLSIDTYVYIYIYIYTYIHIYIYQYQYIYIYVSIYLFIFVNSYITIYIYISIYINLFIYISLLYLYFKTYVYIYIFIHIHIYHIYISLHICIYIYIRGNAPVLQRKYLSGLSHCSFGSWGKGQGVQVNNCSGGGGAVLNIFSNPMLVTSLILTNLVLQSSVKKGTLSWVFIYIRLSFCLSIYLSIHFLRVRGEVNFMRRTGEQLVAWLILQWIPVLLWYPRNVSGI